MALRVFADGRIFGERTGSGPPKVLALHGWGRDHRDFRGLLAGLDAIAVDLPGFGATAAPDSAWGTAQYADAVAALLPEFPAPPVVVGHSFGGRVAVRLAARGLPLRALLLTGVPLVRLAAARRPPLGYRLVRRLHRLGLVGERRMERARRRHGSEDYRRASGVMREVLVRTVNERYDQDLGAIGCPVELVWGERDTVAPVAAARAAEGLLARATLTVCEGADHFSVLDHPATRAALRKHYP